MSLGPIVRHYVWMADLIPLALILVAAVMLAAFFDCWTTDVRSIRHFPRSVWLAAIILLPGIGALLWLVNGKVRRPRLADIIASGHPAGRARDITAGQVTTGQRMIAPDDDPGFLAYVAELNRATQRDGAGLAGAGARSDTKPSPTGTPSGADLPGDMDLFEVADAFGEIASYGEAGAHRKADRRREAQLRRKEEQLRQWESDLRRREERLRRRGDPES